MEPTIVEVDQAKVRLEELIEQAAQGEEVVITRRNRPVARLSAVGGKRRRELGSVKGEICNRQRQPGKKLVFFPARKPTPD